MVCLGNICRSPMAEGILRDKVQSAGLDIETDSAGTANYHVGEMPDERAVATMRTKGIDISDLRGRQFKAEDFAQFDRIFAMDQNNYSDILALAANTEDAQKVQLMLDRSGGDPRSVPDPYYGGDEGFEEVHRMLDEACEIFLKEIHG